MTNTLTVAFDRRVYLSPEKVVFEHCIPVGMADQEIVDEDDLVNTITVMGLHRADHMDVF